VGKQSRVRKNSEQVKRRSWPAVLTGIGLLALFCLFFFYVWGGRITNSDYEGKIVDRWADYSSTTQGARPFFRLVVESDDGKRFTVSVDPNVYESAKVGMRVRSRAGQVVLIDTDRNPAGSK
jgi:hypothetical protein